ncbi:UvrD-helicase domain-containing protein [Vibrio natriegens]|uniref:UvrD-helicase domain-containing protein n=1 Tax=Vibrio natriegens TaxID=691 RepID=UPI003B5BA294
MPRIKPSDITEEDLQWVVKTLNLPPQAFSPTQDSGARDRILKSFNETLDIAACPGSGKTTLLVAKLALLARNWPHKRKGICVLSHTNVAKDEIKNKLGGTEVGQALLSYPHYIGTIHGFVNEFLAFPWLRSTNIPINIVNKDYAHSWRWNSLPNWLIESAEKARVSKSKLSIVAPNYSIGDIQWYKGVLGINTSPYKAMTNVCKKSIENEGIHTFDEMFVWALDFIQKNPSITSSIRDRFPLLFLDEVQDNSELQSSTLHKIFMEGSSPVCRMRLGDIDQAIFGNVGKSENVQTDPFPSNDSIETISLPNSYRFGPSIAKLASPLSLNHLTLVGQGEADEEEHHAIFLIDDSCLNQVLDCYGRYILEVFQDNQEALDKMHITAVGAVHRDNGTDHTPRNVVHYWPQYDPEIGVRDPIPKTFLQYVTSGLQQASSSASKNTGGNTFAVLESIAQGILNKVKEISTDINLQTRKRNHRYIAELLEEMDKKSLEEYLEIVDTLGVHRNIPDLDAWNQKWVHMVRNIVSKLANSKLSEDDPFLQYPTNMEPTEEKSTKSNHNNTYSVESDGRRINIHLSSIHAVKGETHTATLALETYSKAHNLEKLIAQLKGKQIKASATRALQDRLKLHYVAMTRPRRLLCLAMKKSSFTDKNTGKIKERDIEALKKQGWTKIGILNSSGDCNWL